jgi:hypothetical protein
MTKSLPPFPEISDAFTLEDIRKIRDYNNEIFKTMTWEEQKAYYNEAADRVVKEIEELRAAGVQPVYPKRISV